MFRISEAHPISIEECRIINFTTAFIYVPILTFTICIGVLYQTHCLNNSREHTKGRDESRDAGHFYLASDIGINTEQTSDGAADLPFGPAPLTPEYH